MRGRGQSISAALTLYKLLGMPRPQTEQGASPPNQLSSALTHTSYCCKLVSATMEGFPTQHEHHPYCHPEPLPDPGFPASSNLEAAMVYDKSSTSSFSMVYSPPLVLQLQESFPPFEAEATGGEERRMVSIERSSTTSLATEEMDGSGGKMSKKQKRSNANVGVKGPEEKRARGHGDVNAKEAGREPPAGYIHVRARRGQATDSHSLAERVRRGRISEKMKMLQSLVPGCDKVTGKALMLDEIISYVQSLQNQVEFLSMKLASLDPMVYEFGLDIDMYPDAPQLLKMAEIAHEQVQCMGQPTATDAPYTSLVEAQGPTGFPKDGSSGRMMQLQGQEELNCMSMCFFQ